MTKKYALMKAGSPDNFQTDPVALDCLVPYLKKDWFLWEPAAGKRKLVNSLRDRGYNVTASDLYDHPLDHIPCDFLTCAIPWYEKNGTGFEIDCIVTNPPFSLKEEFLGRCYQLGKPFALLMPITTFDSVERRKMMGHYGVEIIFPPKRINFETPNHEKNVAAGKRTNSWFYTAWFTWGLNIGGQLVFCDEATMPGI